MSLNTYNGDGYRVEKTVNGAITRYLYEYDKVVLELDGAGNQTGRNVYGTNLLMRSADRTTYYYMYNGHADVTALLKPDGSIAATYYYDAFGNITDTTGAASNTITFAGYQYDKETGLYYLNARMYDPKTARFLQEDTYTGDRNDPLSLNLYTYCHNEPLMYRDPTGHMADNEAMKLHVSMLGVAGAMDKIRDSGILASGTREYIKQAKDQYNENTLTKVRKDEREVADRRNGGKGKSDFWDDPNFFSNKWYYDRDKVVIALNKMDAQKKETGNPINLLHNKNMITTLEWATNIKATGVWNDDLLRRLEAIQAINGLDQFDVTKFDYSYMKGIKDYYYDHVYNDKRTGAQREAFCDWSELFYSTVAYGAAQSGIKESQITISEGTGNVVEGTGSFGNSFVKTSRTSNLPNLKIGKIYDELNSSPIGRQTLEYMNANDTKGIISYNWDIPKGLSGRAYGDNSFAIFAKHTQSYSNAARTSIHEVTHLMGVQGSRRAEMFARIRELKHIYPNEKIPTDVLKSEFDFVKDAYSDLPSFGGERFTNIMNIK